LTVAKHRPAVDGFDDGGVVTQQDVAEPVWVVGGQLKLGGDVDVSGVGLIHIRCLRFRFKENREGSSDPDVKVKQDASS